MSKFKKILKKAGPLLSIAAPILLGPAGLGLTGMSLVGASAAAGAALGAASGGGLKGALIGGATGAVGGYLSGTSKILGVSTAGTTGSSFFGPAVKGATTQSLLAKGAVGLAAKSLASSALGLSTSKALNPTVKVNIPKAEMPQSPAPPASARRQDTGAFVSIGTSSNIKNQRVSGRRARTSSSGSVDVLGGLGRSGLNI